MVNILDLAKYVGLTLIIRGLSVSHLKIQKLVYYIQAWYMVAFGREQTLIKDVPQAWVNGPVYRAIYDEYKDKSDNMCDHLKLSDFTTETDASKAIAQLVEKMQLTKEQIETIDQIIMLYGSKSQNFLIFQTHSELPWCEKREGLLPYEKSQIPMSLDTMHKYYLERYQRNHATN